MIHGQMALITVWSVNWLIGMRTTVIVAMSPYHWRIATPNVMLMLDRYSIMFTIICNNMNIQ